MSNVRCLRLAWVTSTLLAAAAIACSSVTPVGAERRADAGPADFDAASPSDEPTPECRPVRHLATASQLVSEVAALQYQLVSGAQTRVLEVSDDFQADADLILEAASLPRPPGHVCQTGSSVQFERCAKPSLRELPFPRARGERLVEGVHCDPAGPLRLSQHDTCARLAISKGARFRLRAVLEDMHPVAPPLWPLVEVERPCDATCPDDETRCVATQTCLPDYASCTFCKGEAPPLCACASNAEGAPCSYTSAPDVLVPGTCVRGTCSAR